MSDYSVKIGPNGEPLIVIPVVCVTCERCTWNPGPDCRRPEHEHCPFCGHCMGRHDRAAARPA